MNTTETKDNTVINANQDTNLSLRGEAPQEHGVKAKALKQYLEDQQCDESEIMEALEDYDNEDTVTVNGEELLILCDDEADEKCEEYILDSLWAFNADFIASHVSNDRIDDYSELVKSISAIQEQCEGANSAVKAMIDDLDEFVKDAISADGRGHFISHYDGEEFEATIKIDEKLERSTGHPTFVSTTHLVYIYRV